MKGSLHPQRGHSPHVENHCSRWTFCSSPITVCQPLRESEASVSRWTSLVSVLKDWWTLHFALEVSNTKTPGQTVFTTYTGFC